MSGAELFYPGFILHKNKRRQKRRKRKTEIARKYIDKETVVGIIKEKIGRKTFLIDRLFEDIEIFEWEGFVPDLNDTDYVAQLKARMNDRIKFVEDRDTAKGGFDKLPAEALDALKKVVNALN